jgi:hypothetical protein
MWKDVLKRPFITVGFIAFVLLIPLAVTSTNGMMRRLGGKAWQRLHRLIYVIAPLAVLHFWWMKAGKHLLGQPILFACIVAGLLLFRLNGVPTGSGRAKCKCQVGHWAFLENSQRSTPRPDLARPDPVGLGEARFQRVQVGRVFALAHQVLALPSTMTSAARPRVL